LVSKQLWDIISTNGGLPLLFEIFDDICSELEFEAQLYFPYCLSDENDFSYEINMI